MNLPNYDLQQFKLLLLKQKAGLLAAGETGQQAEEVVELDQARVGRLSRMDAMQAQAMSQETGRRRRQHILNIDTALERVDNGDNRIIKKNTETINPKRLQADPTATLCITCAEALE